MGQAIPAIIGAVVSIATTAVGMAASSAAASTQAANAQAIANYNAQVQQQNAQIAYQMTLYQNQQNAQLAAANIALSQQQQQVAELNAVLAAQNSQIAMAEAAAHYQRYLAGLNKAKTEEDYAQTIRRQGEEQQRRMREENAARIGQLRAKYAASGVTSEGSPIEVIADTARLAETSVQDVAYLAELEGRKQLQEADATKFEAQFSLLDKMSAEQKARNYLGAQQGFLTDAYAAQIEQANLQTKIQGYEYESLAAGARRQIALNQAEVTRMAGQASAAGYLAEGQAAQVAGFGKIAGSAAGAFGEYFKTTKLYKDAISGGSGSVTFTPTAPGTFTY
jgi:hypothetical protein